MYFILLFYFQPFYKIFYVCIYILFSFLSFVSLIHIRFFTVLYILLPLLVFAFVCKIIFIVLISWTLYFFSSSFHFTYCRIHFRFYRYSWALYIRWKKISETYMLFRFVENILNDDVDRCAREVKKRSKERCAIKK